MGDMGAVVTSWPETFACFLCHGEWAAASLAHISGGRKSGSWGKGANSVVFNTSLNAISNIERERKNTNVFNQINESAQ